MGSVGWRALIWFLIISICFISCPGKFFLSKWRPGSASEVVPCFSKPCFPVSPASNNCLQSGYVTPQFLWENQCLKLVLHFLTHQEKHRVANHGTTVAIDRQSWDTTSITLFVLFTVCHKASKWTSYAENSLGFLQILKTFFSWMVVLYYSFWSWSYFYTDWTQNEGAFLIASRTHQIRCWLCKKTKKDFLSSYS